MTTATDTRITSAPAFARNTRSLIRWVCTNNPFYVLSAALFLAGLWVSFGAQTRDVDTWALMSGLAGYTLLLAVAACLLVRFGNVWDDVRTVLLLAVLMFLATSVTFDEVLVLDPGRGVVCYLAGLIFSIAVSEGMLRGTRLRLPAAFRVPYYLILTLFFLYPLALRPLVDDPHSEVLRWALFGFSPVAGLVFLTLLPAIRRGPDYVRDNGSPWRWPLYPWVLFGVLGFAVPARAFLLCWSMHLLGGGDRNALLFGPYFVVPFGLVVAVLLLEIGLVSGRRGAIATALATPVALLLLAVAEPRGDPVFREFRELFTARLGGDPLWVTLLASAGFYAYAALRRVRAATEALTAALVALAVVGPDTLRWGVLGPTQPWPLLAAGALQLGLGLRQRDAWRCLLGTAGLVIGGALAMPGPASQPPLRDVIAFHLALAAVLALGAVFGDAFGRRLRNIGAALVLLAGLAALLGGDDRQAGPMGWAFLAYPLVLAALLAGYGLMLHHRPSLVVAGLLGAFWLGAAGVRGYRSLRTVVAGLDAIALSLALFALALVISLGKSGLLSRWLGAWPGGSPPPAGPEALANPPPAERVWREGEVAEVLPPGTNLGTPGSE
jgi:hypothetical protein